MKKLFASFLAISIFAIAALADDGESKPTCVAGHINSPGVTCVPPNNNRVASGSDEGSGSVFTDIRNFLSEYHLFDSF